MQATLVHHEPDLWSPLSHAKCEGGFVYVSGQAGVGEDGELAAGDNFDDQARRAFINLERVLAAHGSSLGLVIKVTMFLSSMNDAPKMLALRRQWFTAPYPAESMVAVSALYPQGARIVIDVIAAVAAGA